MSKSELLRAALYIRVSTDEQTEYSPEAQRKALIDYAKKHGMEVMPEYIFEDMGISARSGSIKKRDEFRKMLELADILPRPFDVVLIHKFDRFARSLLDSALYMSKLRSAGIKVISISESIEDRKMAALIEPMMYGWAEWYILNLSDEVKKGMTEKARRGEPQGLPPFGYRMKPKENPKDKKTEYEKMPDEAKYVEYIFVQFAENNMRISDIARKLYKMGARTRYGNILGRDRITYILGNPTYIGKTRWSTDGRNDKGLPREDAIIADARHEAIVSDELFQKAQDRLNEMRRRRKPRARPQPDTATFWDATE